MSILIPCSSECIQHPAYQDLITSGLVLPLVLWAWPRLAHWKLMCTIYCDSTLASWLHSSCRLCRQGHLAAKAVNEEHCDAQLKNIMMLCRSMVIAGAAYCAGALCQALAWNTFAPLFLGRVLWGIGEPRDNTWTTTTKRPFCDLLVSMLIAMFRHVDTSGCSGCLDLEASCLCCS